MKAEASGLLLFSLLFGIGCPQQQNESPAVAPTLDPAETPEGRETIAVALILMEARSLAREDKTLEALEQFREVVQRMPDWIEARVELARLAFEEGKLHFMSHQEHKRLAQEAAAQQDEEQAAMRREASADERDAADPLLEEAASHLEVIIDSTTTGENKLNAYVSLASIHAFYERWDQARDHFKKALQRARKPKDRERIRRAIQLFEEEGPETGEEIEK
ncbi:MAG: hypothetical protein O6952_10310 [Planctomycetota bacterium]|nr:hypothetical protein [Planctomycetota bacterium]